MLRSARTRQRGIVLMALAFAAAPFGSAAHAQSSTTGVPNAMQGFSQNRDKPIKIESQSLEMRDKKKEATFFGNVKVIQGDTTMVSDILVVFYDNNDPATGAPAKSKAPAKAAAPGPNGSSSIRRLEAKGHVIVTQKDQIVTGDTAIYDTKTDLTTMLGNVVLSQGPNVMKGDRLIVNMSTSVSRVESDSGRVQGLFQSSGGAGGGPVLPGGPPKPAKQN